MENNVWLKKTNQQTNLQSLLFFVFAVNVKVQHNNANASTVAALAADTVCYSHSRLPSGIGCICFLRVAWIS